MIHLIHKTESNSLGCVYFTVVYYAQLFYISQFAVINKQLRLLSLYKICSSIDSSIENCKRWVDSGKSNLELRTKNVNAKRNLRRQLRKEKFDDRKNLL